MRVELLTLQLPAYNFRGGCWDIGGPCVLSGSNEGGPAFLAGERAQPEELLEMVELVLYARLVHVARCCVRN